MIRPPDDDHSHELTRATGVVATELASVVVVFQSLLRTPGDRRNFWPKDMAEWAVMILLQHGYDIVLLCTFCRDNGWIPSEAEQHDATCAVRHVMEAASPSA